MNQSCPGSISTVSSIVLLLFALIELTFAAKSFLETLPQKSEQFFRGVKLQALAGIHLIHRPFELASREVRLESEPYDKSSSHGGQSRLFQKSRCAVFVRFLSIFCSSRSDTG